MVKRVDKRNRQKRYQRTAWARELSQRKRREIRNKLKNNGQKQKDGGSKLSYNLSQHKTATLVASEVFSIEDNPVETVEFLYKIITKLKKHKPLNIDISDVKNITIDALLYLLAIIDSFKAAGIAIAIQGNRPSDPKARAAFQDSGFLHFVHTKDAKLGKSENTVQIREGYLADPDLAATLVMFTQAKLGLQDKHTYDLYDIIMEIILNTKQHAYPKSGRPTKQTKWYSYAVYDQEAHTVEFSILDTGQGIPATVKTKFGESLLRMAKGLGLPLDLSMDWHLLAEVMKGNHKRSATGHVYRGKGIPKITEYYEVGYITDLTIVSSRGFISTKGDRKIELKHALMGTLYKWRFRRAN